jgi:hypothetical protein
VLDRDLDEDRGCAERDRGDDQPAQEAAEREREQQLQG